MYVRMCVRVCEGMCLCVIDWLAGWPVSLDNKGLPDLA